MPTPLRLAFACFAASVLLGAPALADGDIYQWTDARGVAHYTDDLDNVPEAFRAAMKVSKPNPRSVQRVVESPPPAPTHTPTPAASAPAEPLAELVDGVPESQWRAEAARLDARIAELAPQAAECARDHVNRSPGDGSRKRRAEIAEAEACAKTRAAFAEARAEREAFSELAHRAGVPPGWVREAE